MRSTAKSVQLLFFCCALLLHGVAQAQKIEGYRHTGWTTEDGGPSAARSLAESPDGYLWLTAPEGLFRFDGVSFERMPARRDPHIGELQPQIVYAASSGDIWIGYGHGGVAVYRGGVLRDMHMPNPPRSITGITTDGEGGFWVINGRDRGALTHFRSGKWHEMGEADGVPFGQVNNVLIARDGTTWVVQPERLLSRRRGAGKFEQTPPTNAHFSRLAEDAKGRLWLVGPLGVRAVPDYPHGATGPIRSADREPAGGYRTPLFDRQDNLWMTDRENGVARIAASKFGDARGRSNPATYKADDGLTSDRAYAILEDREGNIWVGTDGGLDRLRTAVVRPQPGIPLGDSSAYAAESDRRGNIYVLLDTGVYAIPHSGMAQFIGGLSGIASPPCRRRDGSVMIAMPGVFLRLNSKGYDTVKGYHTPVYDCGEDGQGRLWMNSIYDGLHWSDRRGWHQLNGPAELSDGFTIAPSGSLFAKVDSRNLMLLDPGRRVLITAAKLGVGAIEGVHRGRHDLFVSGSAGLARIRGNAIRTIDGDRYPWLKRLRGFGQTIGGDSWMISSTGIIRVATSELDRAFERPGSPLAYELFDAEDGLLGRAQKYGVSGGQIFEGGDGSVRFLTSVGVMVIDPKTIVRNELPPPVVVSSILSRGVKHFDPSNISLPAGTSSFDISYSALSLSVPQRVHIRYRLDGIDNDWIDPGSRRDAAYSNLGPGSYNFHVIASNNDGVWNRTGATLHVEIPPTFIQSIWFKLLCALVLGMLIWLAYTLRLRQVRAQMHSAMEVRLAERERIARELHDTLLQGFQGLILHFQAAANHLPSGRPARKAIDEALRRADIVLTEGRDRVRELRTAAAADDLAEAWMGLAAELGTEESARFALTVEGSPRELHPLVCEELQRIGEEAIRNAFDHARATAIVATLTYDHRQLRFDVRDDGVGLPGDVADFGERAGHYGLVGMRERAQRIGGVLTIVSREGAGTEVLLSLPAKAAYADQGTRWRFPRFMEARLSARQ